MTLVVGAAPTLTSQKTSPRAELLALPAAVGAAPAVASSSASRTGLPPVPAAVGATPTVNAEAMRSADTLPLPSPATATNASTQAPFAKAQPMAQPVLMAAIPVNAAPMAHPLPDDAAKALDELVPQGKAHVTYRDGELTIDARNATLAEVLRLVGEKTGATIDIPPGTGQDQIVEHAGPGKPNDVLAQLLNGSRFNFILVNSTQNPQQLAQILLGAALRYRNYSCLNATASYSSGTHGAAANSRN